MKQKITKTSVKVASPKDKDYIIFDSELAGFGMKVTPKGRKVFIYQYRIIGSSKTERITLGRYLDKILHKGKNQSLSVYVAREMAEILRGRIKSGIDPKADKRNQTKKLLMTDLLDEFIRDYVDIKTNVKARTAKEYKGYIRRVIRPEFIGRKVADINRSDIAKLHSRNANQPCKANHVFAILSKFFNWCEERYYRPEGSNPCKHVKKYKIKPKERFLSKSEDLRLSMVLKEALEDSTESIFAIAAIQLLRFTGARRNEILTLKWDWVDFENNVINLPDSKTGKKRIQLNSMAVKVLKSLPKSEHNPFVIEGQKECSHLVNLQKPWARIRNSADLSDLRLHDLRHSFASFAVGHGMSLHTVGMLLGHKQASTTYRYAHLADNQLKKANEDVGEYIHF